MNFENIATPEENEKLGVYFSFNQEKIDISIWSPKDFGTENVLFVLLNEKDAVEQKIPLVYNAKNGLWSAHQNLKLQEKQNYFYFFELERDNQKIKCLDPYAFSMKSYKGDDSFCPAALIDLNSSRAKSLCGKKNETNPIKREKAIIYEVSVRDFTISANTKNKGTYLGFVEKLDYLKDLGVTHIQLMPVMNFYNNNEEKKDFEESTDPTKNNYNWGYDPHGYFSSEGWLSTDSKNPYARISELKTLIHEAHARGLFVILDVVYNHMAKVDFLNDIAPLYYFRTDENGNFTSNSGCGNDIASERKMARKLIVDSTEYWVKNYDVDGFRFDLMGLLDTKTVLDSFEVCKKIKNHVLFIGEGWKMYNGAEGTRGMDQNFMCETENISVFNDEYRDLLKAGGFCEDKLGFLTGDNTENWKLFCNITGQPHTNYSVCAPANNVQYIEAHDGLTLRDNISFNCKLNIKKTKDKKELYQRLKLSNFLLLTSQGIAFLHEGQECGGTRPNFGNNFESVGDFIKNSYRSGDKVNQFIWNFDKEQTELLNYTKTLIDFRKKTNLFTKKTIQEIRDSIYMCFYQCDKSLLTYRIYCEETKSNWYVILNASTQERNLYMALRNVKVYSDKKGASLNPKKKTQGIKIYEDYVQIDPLGGYIIQAEN